MNRKKNGQECSFVVAVHRLTRTPPSPGLGLTIRGGSDANYLKDHPGIFITAIKPGSVAELSQRLRLGDRIIEASGIYGDFHDRPTNYFVTHDL